VASKRSWRVHERWAQMRFSVVGRLLAAPPPAGELRAEIEKLAAQEWRHPITGAPIPLQLLVCRALVLPKPQATQRSGAGLAPQSASSNAGQQIAMSDAVRQALLAQYAAHKSWSIQLHRDNLAALAETQRELQPIPSYTTIRRFFKANGLEKRRRLR
jgi:putative transposase